MGKVSLTGKELMERWQVDGSTLRGYIEIGLPAYDPASKERTGFRFKSYQKVTCDPITHRTTIEPVHEIRSEEDSQIRCDVEQIIFKIEDVNHFAPTIGFPTLNLQTDMRRSQIHRQRVRDKVTELWKCDPSLTIASIMNKPDVTNVCDGKIYMEKTMRDWIKDLCPNRKPGRRQNLGEA